MVLPAQFQLGLELTNIVNPLGTALSQLSSLALVDIIKRSGSDVITEMKVASLLGRHSIDPDMEYSFRAVVAKSDQSVISRYIDIMLESGAGPTVQEALKNPALFSMIIQLSMLSATHTDISLANAIITAVENVLRDTGASTGSAPEYVSLVCTIRACQQQTAFFRWTHVYDAVEHKILRALVSWEEKQQHANGDSQGRRVDYRWRTETKCIAIRCLPFAVLQSLVMWLQSLQSFPEHRLLHIRCDTGITTIVVWCHYLLGLNVTVRLDGVDTCFGQGVSSVFVEESTYEQAGASLLHAADQNEPLFSLSTTEEDPLLDFEARAEAFGYGMVILKQVTNDDEELRSCSHWVIGKGLHLLRTSNRPSKGPLSQSHKDLNEERILQAGRFLFALDNIDQGLLETSIKLQLKKTKKDLWTPVRSFRWSGLVATLITFARIHDLKNCMSMSLTTEVCQRHNIKTSGFAVSDFDISLPGLPSCFHHLSHLLLGHSYTESFVESAVLISGWGWSIFYDTVDAIDPAHVSPDIMRVMPGVPSRQGLRKARILDGPIDSSVLSTSKRTLETTVPIKFLPGISTAKRGSLLIGHHGTDAFSDAFSISQSFEWRSDDGTKCKCRLGFRQMQEICSSFEILQPCSCEYVVRDGIGWIDCHTLDSDITLNSGILYYPTERLALTLQTQGFEKIETEELESQTRNTLMYCHSTQWPGRKPGHPSALSDERVTMKHVVRTVRHADPGITGIEIARPHNGIRLNASGSGGCCWFIYVAENPAARWVQLADLWSQKNGKCSYFLRGDDCCLVCARKFTTVCADAMVRGLSATIDYFMVILL